MKPSCRKLYKVMIGALFCASLMFPVVLLAQKGEMPITASSDEAKKLFLEGRDKVEELENWKQNDLALALVKQRMKKMAAY
jgi:hypothetical protein